ncbi:MAG: hypothetical protein R2710_11800 [Acidimicrobiales bacterium]
MIIGDVHARIVVRLCRPAGRRGLHPDRIADLDPGRFGAAHHPEWPTTVGNGCVIGHIVRLEGCTIEDNSLVGNGSVVLHRAIVRSGALVGSNAVVTNDTEVPSGAMALGIPAKIRLDCVDPAMISQGMNSYLQRARTYPTKLRRLDWIAGSALVARTNAPARWVPCRRHGPTATFSLGCAVTNERSAPNGIGR